MRSEERKNGVKRDGKGTMPKGPIVTSSPFSLIRLKGGGGGVGGL